MADIERRSSSFRRRFRPDWESARHLLWSKEAPTALQVEQLLTELQTQGSHLFKVKSARKLLQRQFFLDASNMVIFYNGSRVKGKKTDIPVGKIREVREGEKDFSKKLNGLKKPMYLMASLVEVRDRWVRALRYMVQMEQLAEQRNEFDKQVRDAFNLADKNGDNALDMDEIMKLLKTLNADIKRKYVQEMFEKADTNKTSGRGKPTLDRDEFVRFYNQLTRRLELEEVFLKYSRGKSYWTVRDISAFLKEGQKMLDVDEEFCAGLVQHCEPDGLCKKQGILTPLGFKNFLMSENQFLFNQEHATVYQDMTRPMTHYFINSSHNTYLAEDQLRGPSRVEMYITALRKGCRCVELDCWDGPDSEPVIYHGYTLTSKILFKDVIHAVKEYAFKTSEYPVILSLENHCSVEQQRVMAQHMDRILGDMIWAPESELAASPSPEELKCKIIIKGKKLPLAMEGIDEDEVSDEDEAAESKQQLDGSNNNNNNNNKRMSTIHETNKADGTHKKIKLSPALSHLTSMKSAGFRTVDQAAATAGAFLVFSLGESKVQKLMVTSALGLNVVTHRKLIRTYPAGSRTDSSNYDPVPAWNHGCQIVALNFQTGSQPMQLNHGRFLDNGGCGYVLKPNLLLADEMFGIMTGTMDRHQRRFLTLTLISGVQIPKPNESRKGEVIDPFVKIEMHGVPDDCKEYSSKVVQNNGFNPRWYESFQFTVRVPELALLRFVVKDEDPGLDDFIAYYCLPFNSLKEGYRHFPLFDCGHRISNAYIFVHVAISNI